MTPTIGSLWISKVTGSVLKVVLIDEGADRFVAYLQCVKLGGVTRQEIETNTKRSFELGIGDGDIEAATLVFKSQLIDVDRGWFEHAATHVFESKAVGVEG